MSDDLFPGDKRALRRPGTELRRRVLFGQIAVLTDSLTEAGLWPLARWAGKIDRYAHLAGAGLNWWFKEIYADSVSGMFGIDPEASALMRMIPYESKPITPRIVRRVDWETSTLTITQDVVYMPRPKPSLMPPRHKSNPSRVPAGLQRKPWDR